MQLVNFMQAWVKTNTTTSSTDGRIWWWQNHAGGIILFNRKPKYASILEDFTHYFSSSHKTQQNANEVCDSNTTKVKSATDVTFVKHRK